MKKGLSFTNIRRIYAVFFFSLFLLLIYLSDYRHIKGYQVTLFLDIDPLISISSFLTSGTVYRGLILSLFIIVPTIFLGRFFCSWICPLGILNQGLSVIFRKKKINAAVEENRYQKKFRAKYYVLFSLLILSSLGALQVGLLDPIVIMTRSFSISFFPALHTTGLPIYIKHNIFNGGILISFILIAILFSNRFLTRFWCRVICPLGALLGIISIGPTYRIRRDIDKCTNCNQCVENCQGACDPHASLRITECHVCLNCIENCPEGALHYGHPGRRSSNQEPLDISRRRFIETGVATLALFPMMKSSLTSESTYMEDIIRPPGALGEKDFLKRCIKCSSCMRVCPTNVLQPALLEGGFEGIWSPILINRIGYCEYNCTLCGQACPTGAIEKFSLVEKLGKGSNKKPIKIGTAFYDRGRCLPWAMNVECIVCEEVCPVSPKAIWFENKEVITREGKKKKLKLPHLEPDLCIGCGICENKCPVKGKAAIRVSSVGETRSKKNKMLISS